MCIDKLRVNQRPGCNLVVDPLAFKLERSEGAMGGDEGSDCDGVLGFGKEFEDFLADFEGEGEERGTR